MQIITKDGWLDLAMRSSDKMNSSFVHDIVKLSYGGPDGFKDDNIKFIDVASSRDIETADFNNDGWLDMVVCSYADSATLFHDLGVSLLWGGPDGFKEWNAQWLPGLTPIGPVAADFDSDGFLDLFLPNYHSQLTRESLASYLFWGGPNGFDTHRRTNLINNSACDGLAADFNNDGLLDLAVVNHTRRGNHYTQSKIFYNDGNRFENPRIEKIPTHGAHWSYNEDMGHIYNRKWQQMYESSVFKCSKNAKKENSPVKRIFLTAQS